MSLDESYEQRITYAVDKIKNKGTVTRAEVVTILMRFCEDVVK